MYHNEIVNIFYHDTVYIPRDLEDCFDELEHMLDPRDIKKIKTGKTIEYHHGLGTWLRNNWGLWRGSRLSAYFKGKEIN
jgi:hypothetical protein